MSLKANLVFVTFLLCLLQMTFAEKSTEYTLFTSKFANISKLVRPVANWNDRLRIDINVRLKKIASVIEDHQTVSIYVRLDMSWQDSNLKWDPKEFNDLQSIVLPASEVWIPDIHLINSASEDDRIYPSKVEIFSNGTIVTYPLNHLYAHCDFDFSRFPFDYQSCDFLIGSMMDKSKVSVRVRTSIELSQILPNPEWSVIKLSDASDYSLKWFGDTSVGIPTSGSIDNWSVNKFTLTLKRAHSFYVNLFIWPVIFILFITTSVFILPPSCVERITLGVLLLMSLVVLSLMLESYTPKTSANVSIIGKLLGFAMFMVTSATVASTLIISVDRDSFVYRTVPKWLKSFMLRVVGKLVFKYGSLDQALGEQSQLRDDEIELIDTNTLLQQHQQRTTNENGQLINTSNSQADVSVSSPRRQQQHSLSDLDLNQAQTLLALINNHIAMLRIRLQEGDLKDRNKNNWYLIAVALDRFSLIFYTSIMLLGLFIVLI